MRLRRIQLSSGESAALTRLVIAYCLGRGSLCYVSRSLSLQISHAYGEEDYIHYKWRRLCQYLPRTTAPQLYRLGRADANENEAFGQWRLRVGSRHFRVASNLLYPDGNSGGIRLTSEPLELVGAEGIGALWADRGRIHYNRSSSFSQGRLNLSRFDWTSAALIAEWIGTLTGSHGELLPNPRLPETPMLFFDHLAIVRLMDALSGTWMAQAACLKPRFLLKESEALREAQLRLSISNRQRELGLAEGDIPRRHGKKRRSLPIVVPPIGHEPLVV
jgi:hypothetical protein